MSENNEHLTRHGELSSGGGWAGHEEMGARISLQCGGQDPTIA